MTDQKTKYLWKSLSKGCVSQHNDFKWVLGKWYKHEGNLEMCRNGFHASESILDAMRYVSCEVLAKVEVRGQCKKLEDKQCWSEMRIVNKWVWEKEDSVKLAIYSADSVLNNFEKEFPLDNRPRLAIKKAKDYLNGKKVDRSAAESAALLASSSAWSVEARSAAMSAARSEAMSAARSAARLAAEAWLTLRSAARSASRSAARLAAESAARSAETAQSAALSAARSAEAWSSEAWAVDASRFAARSACLAALSAARSAAWSAAKSAAELAEDSAAWSARSALSSAESAAMSSAEPAWSSEARALEAAKSTAGKLKIHKWIIEHLTK